MEDIDFASYPDNNTTHVIGNKIDVAESVLENISFQMLLRWSNESKPNKRHLLVNKDC